MVAHTQSVNGSIPSGKLSGIGLKLDWDFKSIDVLKNTTIHSQIFYVEGIPCHAHLALNSKTKEISLCVRSITKSELSENLKVTLYARAFVTQKDITVGNQMHQINLFTPIVLQNFLNEGILSKYDRLSIELIFQPEARIHSPLKTFWNCPQTADVLILSEIPGENPLFVHRKFVLDAIPKIHSVANLYRERYSQDPLQKRYMELLDPILDELFVSLKRKMKCEESSTILPCKDSTDRTDKRPITGTKSFNDRNITCASGKPSTSSRDTLLESPKERAMPNKSTNGKETPTQNTFLHSCTPPKNTSLQSNAPLKNPGLITDRYEIWIWPGTFPKNSCIDVMRWVYFQQLSPTFCLHDFNPFMKLLEDLGEWHHFQEQALRARSSILSNKELLDYISEPCFQQGFAKEILRDCLTTKMKAKLFTLARDAFADLIERDKTGVISEFFQSIGLRLDDPSN